MKKLYLGMIAIILIYLFFSILRDKLNLNDLLFSIPFLLFFTYRLLKIKKKAKF